MRNAGQLLFGDVRWFPVVWSIGLLGFVAYWWYVCRDVRAMRRLFLILWLPAALVAGAIYSLEGQGQAVTESLRLMVQRDPATVRLLFRIPADGFATTYAVVVGGTVAALTTMALQLVGVALGVLLSVGPSSRRGGSRR